MEFVFWALILVIFGMTGIYAVDSKGWNATFKRVSTMARAHVEAGKPVKALDPVKDMEDWDARFSGKEAKSLSTRHEIVKRDFDQTHLGPWPRWKCKCGYGEREVVLYDVEDAIQSAKRKSELHVETGDNRDKAMKEWTGSGTW